MLIRSTPLVVFLKTVKMAGGVFSNIEMACFLRAFVISVSEYQGLFLLVWPMSRIYIELFKHYFESTKARIYVLFWLQLSMVDLAPELRREARDYAMLIG